MTSNASVPKKKGKKGKPKRRAVPVQPRSDQLTGGSSRRSVVGLAMARGHPTVRLGSDEIGYCMDPERPDDCLRAALATATQIPIEQVPDPRLDRRLAKGDDPEQISHESWAKVAQWLDDRGLVLVLHETVPADRKRWVGVVPGDEVTPELVAEFNLTPRDNPFMDHCLVMSYDEIIFDPAISRDLSDSLPPGVALMPRGAHTRIAYGLSFDRKEVGN